MASQPDGTADLALSTLAERALASLLYLASHNFFPSIPEAAPYGESVPTVEKKRMQFMENVREFINIQLHSGILAMMQDSPPEFLQLLENLRTSFDINGKFWYEVMVQYSQEHEDIALELQKAQELGQFNIMLKSQFCMTATQEALQSILRIYGRLSHKMGPLTAKLAAAKEAVNALSTADVSVTQQQDKVYPDNATGKATEHGIIIMPAAVGPKSTKKAARLQAAREKANDLTLRLNVLQHECNGVIKAVLEELAWKPPMSTLDMLLRETIIFKAGSDAIDVEQDETNKVELETGKSRTDQLKFVRDCIDNFIFDIKMPEEVSSVLVKMNQIDHIKTMLANFQDCDDVVSVAEDVAKAPVPDPWQSESLPVKNLGGSPQAGRNLQETLAHMLDFPPDVEDDLSEGEEEQVEKSFMTPDKVDLRSALAKKKHGMQSKLQLQHEFKTYITNKDHQVLDTGSSDTENCFEAIGLSLANHEVLANHDWNLPSDAMNSINKFKMTFVRYLRAARDNNVLPESQEKLQVWRDLKDRFGPFLKPDIADLEHLGLILLTFQASFNVAFRLVIIDRTTGSPRELYLGHSRKAPIVFVSHVHGHYEGYGTIGRPGISKVDSESLRKLTLRTNTRLFPDEYYNKQSGWDDVAAPSETDVIDTATPEDDIATPENDTASLKDDIAAPKDDIAAPEDSVATPEDDVTTPKDDIATPKNDAPSLKDDITTPEGDVATPEDDSASPKDDAINPPSPKDDAVNPPSPKDDAVNPPSPKGDAIDIATPEDETPSEDGAAASEEEANGPIDDGAASPKADIEAITADDEADAPKDDDATSSKADIDTTISDDDAASSKADIEAITSEDEADAPKDDDAAPKDETADKSDFVKAFAPKGLGAFVKGFAPKGRKGNRKGDKKGKDNDSFELEIYQLRKLKYKDGKFKVVAERSCICM